ncbi:LytR/AlgR family response regulator transcription factor [Lactiplantibacillus herbarum]|uniref:LytR/AlgR family response regulator transcription factor n=1 Tax=Lactiplantibacillus herbarum TaxID=1670446 RepID=UPI00064F024B|nr:LytTR family DNA-binding domain-containing protein [Lactiplantibacillus herbarum]
MISVYICEDAPKQLEQIRKTVNEVIVDNQLDMGLELFCSDPWQLWQEIQDHRPDKAIYILDISLNSDINGIELATKIRSQDVRSKIIFVTTHSELSLLVFKYQIEALDFILKDFPEALYDRFKRALQVAQTRFEADASDTNEYIQVKVGEMVRSINVNDILFFESSPNPHKIVMHLNDGQLEFYGLLKNVPTMNPAFYKCHKSYVVNLSQMSSLDRHMRVITMINGETVLCSLQATRYLAKKFNN